MAPDMAPVTAFAIPAPELVVVGRAKRRRGQRQAEAPMVPTLEANTVNLEKGAHHARRLSEKSAKLADRAGAWDRRRDDRISYAIRLVLDATFFDLLREVLEERELELVRELPDHTRLEVWEEAKRRTVPGYAPAEPTPSGWDCEKCGEPILTTELFRDPDTGDTFHEGCAP